MSEERPKNIPENIDSILESIGLDSEGWRVIDSPGTISPTEARAFAALWADMLEQLGELVEAVDDVEDYGAESQDAHGLALLSAQRLSLVEHLKCVRSAGALLRFLYLFDGVAPAVDVDPPAPYPDPMPGPVVDVPADVNAVVYLVDQLRDSLEPGSVGEQGQTFIVDLPEGELEAFSLGVKGSGDCAAVNWLGEAKLILRGHKNGTTIDSLIDSKTGSAALGWGATINLTTMPSWQDRQKPGSDPSWAGRVEFVGLEIRASGRCCAFTNMAYKRSLGLVAADDYPAQYIRPYKDVVFTDCQFVDSLDPKVRPLWGIGTHQTALSVRGCFVDLPSSKEHFVYAHNCYGVPTEITSNTVVAIGGQVLQYANRNYEGPNLGRALVHVFDNHFTGYCRDASRASAAISLTGSGLDWLIEENQIFDIDPPQHSGFVGFGVLVAHGDGGEDYYLLDSGRANGVVELKNNLLGQVNGRRAALNIKDCEQFLAGGNMAFGLSVSVESAGVLSYSWRGNNTPLVKSLAHAALRKAFSKVPTMPGQTTPAERAVALLVDPPFLVDKRQLGKANADFQG